MCVERGLVNYNEKMATYWPEFAAKGKGELTVAQVLAHRAGVFTVEGPITLEEALEYIGPDEYVEVTPKSIRLRKIYLNENDRKRFAKQFTQQ